MNILTAVLVTAGLLFLAVSAVGLIRFPDFYARTHVVSKSETLGVMLVLAGIMVHHRLGDGTLHLLMLIGFAMVANSTAIHALASAAHRRTTAERAARGEHGTATEEGRG